MTFPLTPMTLGEIRTYLDKLDPDMITLMGLTSPHSWRGSYAEPAAEPRLYVPVRTSLDTVEQLLSDSFTGWKGGTYTYTPEDYLHLDYVGQYSGDLVMNGIIFFLMFRKD